MYLQFDVCKMFYFPKFLKQFVSTVIFQKKSHFSKSAACFLKNVFNFPIFFQKNSYFLKRAVAFVKRLYF